MEAQRPAAILHCRDFTSIEVARALEAIAPLDGVAGNNDGPEMVARFGRRKIIAVEDIRVGLLHGDGKRGTTPQRALTAFADEAVDVILFGHSHIPSCVRCGGLWLINPGSPTDKRGQARFSFAVLDIDGAAVDARLVFFEGTPSVPKRVGRRADLGVSVLRRHGRGSGSQP
ncbi:MAG: YfcE family phosphodiesterase [Candidatus Eremiobacteraeota bacterium]|nr:YfcE family phosphodiesterase [Candidatus Eremiobacteraeota bacterium]